MQSILRCSRRMARPSRVGARACPVRVSRPVRADVHTRAMGVTPGPGVSSLAASMKPFVGTNCYYLLYMAVKGDWDFVQKSLEFIHAQGFNVVRTWAFNDGQNDGALQAKHGLLRPENAQALKAFDMLLDKVEAFNCRPDIVPGVNDIKLMLTLTNCVNDYGGLQQYVRWAKGRDDPGNLGSNKFADMERFEFFNQESSSDPHTSPANKAQAFFEDYVKQMVGRCKNRSCIHSWDICNEPRNRPPGARNAAIGDWVHRTAALIKSIDRKHPVTVGSEGFFGPPVDGGSNWQERNPWPGANEGCNWIYEGKSPHIDFVSIHAWGDQWRSNDKPEDWLKLNKDWLDSHIDACKELGGKPLVLQEYNMPAGAYRQELFNYVAKRLQEPGNPLIGAMCWMLAAEGYGGADAYTMFPSNTGDLAPLKDLCQKVNRPRPS